MVLDKQLILKCLLPFLKPQRGCLIFILIFANNVPEFLTLDFTLKILFNYVSSSELFIIIYRYICTQGHSSQYFDMIVCGTSDDHVVVFPWFKNLVSLVHIPGLLVPP